MMMEMMKQNNKTSHRWWFDSHNIPRGSPWLQSTLAELDGKTKAMLKLIEGDADSFAQRAEMYYKKRPELISMVEDFYRAHRSLVEKYDQAKFESGTRLHPPSGSPIIWSKNHPEKFTSVMDRAYDSYSDSFDPEESAESDVEDPEYEDSIKICEEHAKPEDLFGADSNVTVGSIENVSSGFGNDEVMKLREEIEKLNEENRIQKGELMRKDEEKREVIRQLSVAIDLLNEENAQLRKYIPKKSVAKESPFQFSKFKSVLSGILSSGGSSGPKTTLVPL